MHLRTTQHYTRHYAHHYVVHTSIHVHTALHSYGSALIWFHADAFNGSITVRNS